MAGDFPQLDPDYSPLLESPRGFWLPEPPSIALEEDGSGSVAPGGSVGFLQDLSESGAHLIQATAGARPTYKTSGGLHWLEFPAVDDFLSATLALDQPYTRVSAWRSGPADTTGNFWSGVNCDLYISSGQLFMWEGGTDFGTGLTIGADEDFVAVEIVNGASSSLAIDNGTAAVGNPGSDAISSIRIGTTDGRQSLEGMRFGGGVILAGVATAAQIANLSAYFAFRQGRTSLAPRPLRAIDTDGGSGRNPQPKALPYWWQSYLAEWLAELEEREAEYRRTKAVEDAKAAAERYRQALATIAARRAEEHRQAAEAAALRREEDAKLAQRLAAIQREKDERLMQERARIEAALQRVNDRQEAARRAAEVAELEALRSAARNRRRRFPDRFEAAIEAARRQGWRAKLN